MKLVPKQPVETADVSRGRMTLKTLIKTFAGGLIALVCGYLLIALIGGWIGSRIPDDWERKVAGSLGDHQFGKTLDEHDERSSDWIELDEILGQLMTDEDLRDLPYEVRVLDSYEPNAFAVPGGVIYVTTGLLDTVESRAGRSFVIAHELGHHEERHIFKSLGSKAGVNLVVAALGLRSLNSTFFEPAGRRNSRAMESEADEYALRLVFRKMGDQPDVLEFLEDMTKQERQSRLLRYLETHPQSEDRVDRLRGLLDELRSE